MTLIHTHNGEIRHASGPIHTIPTVTYLCINFTIKYVTGFISKLSWEPIRENEKKIVSWENIYL